MDGRELRNYFGEFPTGVTIVCWFDGVSSDRPACLSVNS